MGTCEVQGLGFGERGVLNIRNLHTVSESRFIGMKKCRHLFGAVQKNSTSKAAGHLVRGTYRLLREHDKRLRTQLADFFNSP